MEIIKEKDAIAIEENVNQKVEHKFIGRYRKKIDGGKIFEFNKETRQLKLAEYQQTDTKVFGAKKAREKLIVNKNCIYLEALNMKNAVKRLIKGKIIFAS